jgi:DNA-binding MarR family transcriptional regulator
MSFDVNRIDDVIHGRVRLGIVAYLATVEAADFNELKALLETTGGNLSVHLRKLEGAGYVKVTKSFISRKSLTRTRITPKGRAAFLAYLSEVQALVDSHPRKKPDVAPLPAAESVHVKHRRA